MSRDTREPNSFGVCNIGLAEVAALVQCSARWLLSKRCSFCSSQRTNLFPATRVKQVAVARVLMCKGSAQRHALRLEVLEGGGEAGLQFLSKLSR